MFLDKNYTIVDVETTGGSPFFSRIIEVGLLRVEKGEVVEEFQTLLNPGTPIPAFITGITGITDRDVVNSPTFEDIAGDLLQKFEDAVFVAHNASFDYGFISEEFRRIGYAFNVDRMCTVKLSRAVYKEHKRHNLTTIIERHGFVCENRHRAFDDAKVLWDFMQHVAREVPSDNLQKVLRQVTTKTRGGAARTKKLLPEITYETETGELLDMG